MCESEARAGGAVCCRLASRGLGSHLAAIPVGGSAAQLLAGFSANKLYPLSKVQATGFRYRKT